MSLDLNIKNSNSKNRRNMETYANNKMLIVDDDLLQLYMAKKILGNTFDVTTTTNGYKALELVEKEDFHFVLLDINLGDPYMDGIRVMRTMRMNHKFRHTKIVAVTAHAVLRDWYVAEGFNDLIVKPLLSNTIFEKLEKVEANNVMCCWFN